MLGDTFSACGRRVITAWRSPHYTRAIGTCVAPRWVVGDPPAGCTETDCLRPVAPFCVVYDDGRECEDATTCLVSSAAPAGGPMQEKRAKAEAALAKRVAEADNKARAKEQEQECKRGSEPPRDPGPGGETGAQGESDEALATPLTPAILPGALGRR